MKTEQSIILLLIIIGLDISYRLIMRRTILAFKKYIFMSHYDNRRPM